ncbi:hypothetical protein LEP1GSC008_3109 [Leptospira kirschneri serovar Bulgarica str. Nikolaevo]|uniref:Uncharacterized protein n=1 Tax=Leptospira kirschneri serovar Bulgarica str. Nikolaevo TaxID=1240687 RepID=M6F833_9LEPT|nr:hypothetical protein LEP1GSC008_3109 [Leptospira kirschneri serovar Bulgarica str. Nikolaevo]
MSLYRSKSSLSESLPLISLPKKNRNGIILKQIISRFSIRL